LNVPLEVASGLVGVIFGAGAAWTTIKSIRGDLNGLGRKIGVLQDQDVRIIVCQLVICESRADREFLAKPLLER